jgi:class 3 adenylate cyclase/tetratricopeptide (TPR) repeat protein
MRCPACASDCPPGATFCAECGARLVNACPRCGYQADPVAKFCQECGGPLGSAAGPAAPSSTPARVPESAAPSSYTPAHLAAKILAGRRALEGERKQVTVLFADIVGSTEQIRGRDPEEVQQLLDGVVDQMMDAVHRFEGTVSRRTGDGLIALFGAPIAHEDHAVRAGYAALEMLDAARRHAIETRRTHGIALAIRVGLSSGEVVVRTIRDDLHMDYTAMGETVHLAARMEQVAEPGTAALAPETRALTEGYLQARALGPVSIKGFEDPVEVYQLLGAGEARTRLQATASRGLTRFAGRQSELEALHAALVRADAGHGQVAALVGEPGVGKSRLIWELTHAQETAGWQILECGAVSYGTTISYLPIVELLKRYFQIEGRDDPDVIREKVLCSAIGLDAGLRSSVPALVSLLGVDPQDASWNALDPPRRRQQTLDGVTRLLLRAGQQQPLLLVVEDLHWIDSESQVFVDRLVDSLPTAGILLLVSYRPKYRHEWVDRDYYTRLRLDPLPATSTDALLSDLLGDDPTLDPLKALLTERTDGNPLFLEETVRTLVETGAIAGERGPYRLIRPVTDVRVPATVQAVLAARIDRLPAEQKRLLQSAAVVGKDVPAALLQAIADISDAELQHGLAQLQAAELLYPVSLYPEPEYTFKHALTHEVAYGSLLHERRKLLHARIVAAIERLYPDRLDEQVERLAHHALRAEVREKAVEYCRRAGHRAHGRSVPREAGDWFERALEALSHLPESRETLEQSIDLRIDLRGAPNRVDFLERAYHRLVEAEQLAERLGDRERLGRVLISMNSYLYFGDHVSDAFSVARRALAIGEEIGDLFLQAAAHFGLGQDYDTIGDYPHAIEQYRETLACLDRDEGARSRLAGNTSPLASHARSCISWSLAERGELVTALAYGKESLRVSDEIGLVTGRTGARLYLGIVLNRQGEFQQAVPHLEQARELTEMANNQASTGFNGLSGALGTAYLHVGRVSEAISLLERCRARSIEQGAISDLFIGSPALVEAYLRIGKQDAALDVAHESVRYASEQGKRGFGGWATHALAEAEARDPPNPDAAEARYREALTTAKDLGMRPLQARCRLGLGTLYRQTGRTEAAAEHLATAVTMLREMEMTFWLPTAERELAAMDA